MTDDDKNNLSNKGYTAGEVEILLRISLLEMEFRNFKNGDFVSRREFEPVQKVVYGLVALILVAVVGALMVLVLK